MRVRVILCSQLRRQISFPSLTFSPLSLPLCMYFLGLSPDYLIVAETEGNCYDTIACQGNTW